MNYNNQHSELTPPLRPPVFKRATATVDIDHVAGLISSYQIPTKHINGGCEYRAHALSALLEMDGIYSYKVWAFAPSVVSAVGTTQIEIATTYGVPVKWGFHVAVAVWSKDGHRVFDPSLDTESLSVQEWLVRFGCKECSTFVTDRANVSFYSWDGRIAAKGHSARGIDGVDFDIPTKKPVFTGAFFECVAGTGPNCQTGNWIEESLALNAAGEVLVEALSDPTLAEADAAAIRENLKSNTSLLKALEDPAPMLESVRIAKQQLIEAKGNWRRRLANAYWRRRM